jgi:hypothetical protein
VVETNIHHPTDSGLLGDIVTANLVTIARTVAGRSARRLRAWLKSL